jgi:hypothetical protein
MAETIMDAAGDEHARKHRGGEAKAAVLSI